jgi:hypothetical protein
VNFPSIGGPNDTIELVVNRIIRAVAYVTVQNRYSSSNGSSEILLEQGMRIESKYPQLMYLTIIGESWFRGDFNISYRFINRPGPDGDKMDLLKPLSPPDKEKVDNKILLIIIIVSSVGGFFCLATIAILSCLYVKHRKQDRIQNLQQQATDTPGLSRSSSS